MLSSVRYHVCRLRTVSVAKDTALSTFLNFFWPLQSRTVLGSSSKQRGVESRLHLGTDNKQRLLCEFFLHRPMYSKKMVLQHHQLEDVYGFGHPSGVVICPRTFNCVHQFNQLKKFLAVTSWALLSRLLSMKAWMSSTYPL